MGEYLDTKETYAECEWCKGCKQSWRYATQMPCSACLASKSNSDKPLYFEKETNDG